MRRTRGMSVIAVVASAWLAAGSAIGRWRLFRYRRIGAALAALILVGAGLVAPAAPAAAAPGDSADGRSAAGAEPAARPDRYEKAADQNNDVERAATQDRSDRAAEPLVPQRPGVPGTDVDEPADQGGGLTGTTAPAPPGRPATVAAPRPEPVPDTSAEIEFADAGTPVSAAAALSPYLAEIVREAARARTVEIETGALARPLTAETVAVELFDDVTVDLRTGVALHEGVGAAGQSSRAYTAGGKDAAAVITIIDGDLHGAFWQGATRYGIEPLGGGQHLVYEDGRVFPNEGEPLEGDEGSGPSRLGPAGGGVGTMAAVPVIDVMVAFDEDAQSWFGSVAATQAEIIEMVNLSNMVYANSQNDQQLALTNILDLNYTPNAGDGTTNYQTYLSAIRSKTDGIVDNLHTQRDSNSADLVAVVGQLTGACGVAYLPSSADPAELNAYSLTDGSCAVGNLSFPHELGHNMCAHHDPANAGTNPCASDGFGHFSSADGLRTVMAYPSPCGACTRIPYFSNPNVTFSGWTTGITGSRNNSRVLEMTDLDIAAYRAPNNSPAVAGVDGNSCIFNTIEDAVSMAPAGSTIYVAPGTYPAVSSVFNYNISKSLDIVKGTADCEPTSGGSSTDVVLQLAAGSTVDAVVEVSGGATVRFDRITIQGGNSAEGTLYALGGAQVTLDDTIVRNGANPSTSVGGGAVRIATATTEVTTINDSQIENSSATFGGGVYVDAGTFTMNGAGNVELNTAGTGGGIYATNGGTVVLSNNADVMSNSANGSGGGVYLTGASTLSMSDLATYVGFSSQGNSASTGAGVYVAGGSTATVADGAAVLANTGGWGAGMYGIGAGSVVRVNAGGRVSDNSVTNNGGGVLVTQSALADLNAGAGITGNSAGGWGGGIAVFTPATLDADGGTPTVDPVLISNNSAGTVGGGLWSSGSSALDTVHIVNNTATTEGGGLYVTGSVSMAENFACGPTGLAMEQYCNEFRGNTAGTTGGAVRAVNGTFTAVQVAFIDNDADQAAVILASGSASVSIRAALAIGNTETAATEGLVTLHDTASLTLVGMTFADHSERFLDTDGSATATVSRVLTTTSTWDLVATPSGGCNISSVSANLPGLLVTTISFTSTSRTDYMPAPNSPAIDRCAILGGHTSDLDDTAVIDVPPAGANDYDVGAFEAPA